LQLAGGRDCCGGERSELVLRSNLAWASFLSCMAPARGAPRPEGVRRRWVGTSVCGEIGQSGAPLARAKRMWSRLIFAGEPPTGLSCSVLEGKTCPRCNVGRLFEYRPPPHAPPVHPGSVATRIGSFAAAACVRSLAAVASHAPVRLWSHAPCYLFLDPCADGIIHSYFELSSSKPFCKFHRPQTDGYLWPLGSTGFIWVLPPPSRAAALDDLHELQIFDDRTSTLVADHLPAYSK
jgi:hypothetical protein